MLNYEVFCDFHFYCSIETISYLLFQIIVTEIVGGVEFWAQHIDNGKFERAFYWYLFLSHPMGCSYSTGYFFQLHNLSKCSNN